MRHILSVYVENEPGVLSRVSGLFSGRGFNIESLNVAPTLEKGVSHMLITTVGDDQIVEQIIKQLRKLITVIKVVDLTKESAVERELMLVKVQAEANKKSEILSIAEIFRCKIIDLSLNELTLELTGTHDKLSALLNILDSFGIKELVRTGTLAIKRSAN